MPPVWSLRKFPVDGFDWETSLFLSRAGWESSSSADLVAPARAGDLAAFYRAWKTDLRQRRLLFGTTRELMTAWSPRHADNPVTQAMHHLAAAPLKQGKRPFIQPKVNWVTRLQPLIAELIQPDRPPAQDPVEVLAALEILWTAGDKLALAEWWPLWKRTLRDAVNLLADRSQTGTHPDERLIREGELPLLAGLVFRPLAGSSDWIRQGQKFLARQLTARTDTDGTVHSELLPRLPYWLAPLVRATHWSRQAGQSLWDVDERELLNDVIERSVALCRPDGKLALTNGHAVDALPLLRRAADDFGWSASNPSRACLTSLAEHAAGLKPRKSGAAAITLMPSNQSDWARFALLRTDWTAGSASIAIAHHQPLPQIDITVQGRPILHGEWGLELQLGSTGIELAEEWSCVCWESQPEADYVELQMEGPGKLRVERLILLSREDHFLMLADSVSGAPPGPLALRSRLPLAHKMDVLPEPGRRSYWLNQSPARVRMLPLAFPADTVQSSPHRCTIEPGSVVLEHLANGQGLFAPVIFDFHPLHRRREVDWRKLTVTEEGRVVTSDVAAAFRWKIGREQWLLYRSLKTPTMPRAALGYHTGNGFVLGRFDTNGDVDPMLMVENA